MIRRLANWWFKQTLLERSARYRTGYAWAMGELHRGNDPQNYVWHEGGNTYFDMGAQDAMFDWRNSINADAMWDKARAAYDEDLERTQRLPELRL